MTTRSRSISQIVNEQVKKWELGHRTPLQQATKPVITISRQPGSKGRRVAGLLADRYGLDLYSSNIITEVAKLANMSQRVVSTLDERGRSLVDDIFAEVARHSHMASAEFLKHLVQIIGTIGGHGHAVIIGRGAGFILPGEETLMVRIVEPRSMRIRNVMKEFELSLEEAETRVSRAEVDRRQFIHKYFNADINDPGNYDIVLNMRHLTVDSAAELIRDAWQQKFRSAL